MSRNNLWEKIGRGKYKGIHRMPFDLESRAATHELNRQRVVSMIILDLYCMATLGYIPKGTAIGVKGAVSQNLTGSKADDSAAAHCVPRQLFLGTKTPQLLLQHDFPERAFVIDALFAETDILPVNFNKADSRVERKGLSKAFLDACDHVITKAQLDGKLECDFASIVVKAAYEIYRTKTQKAYQAAMIHLQNKIKPKIGTGSRVKFKIRKGDLEKWKEQYKITEMYSETLRNSKGVDVVLVPKEYVNGVFRLYNMIV